MQSSRKNNTEYTLILNEEEAQWICEMVQNPLSDGDGADEMEVDKKMRKLLWDALTDYGQ